jgi:hypothetical protein
MIKLVGGKLKGPDGMDINGFKVRRVIGGEIHKWYRKLTPNSEGNRIVDSLFYRGEKCSVIISADSSNHGTLIHTSIALDDEDPSWETIKALKEVVFGDIDVMMVLPKQENYVNVHKHAFHLWQMPVPWEIS